LKVKIIAERLQIAPKEVSRLLERGEVRLLDVRGEDERQLARIEGVPELDEKLIDEILSGWDRATAIVLHCHSGFRSLDAARFLIENGFTDVKSMSGGIDRWSRDVDPSVPRY